MRLFLVILLTLSSQSGFTDPLKRIDPHGAVNLDLKAKVDLKKQTECTICHASGKEGLTIKANVASTCTSCHGSSPHSGAADHLGRMFKGEILNCLSCHSPHRAGQQTPLVATGFFKSSKPGNPKPMLKRNCTECHQW